MGMRLVFGRLDRTTVDELRSSFGRSLTSSSWSPLPLLFPRLRDAFGPWSPSRDARAARAAFERLLAREAARRSGPGAGTGGGLYDDLLLLEDDPLAPDALARQLSRVLTIIGGIDTVAVALSWCCLHLLRNPAMLARAQDDARSDPAPRSASGLTYLEAACMEAVRIHPAVPLLVRIVTAPVAIGGHTIQPGTVVVAAIGLVHRRADVFAEPHRFRPERFLEAPISPHHFMPFGGGMRRCLGQALAFPQMAIVLGELLRTVDLEASGRLRDTPTRRWVMMVPKDPLTVRFRRAASDSAARDEPAAERPPASYA
jgi:cytochrome P450